VVRLLDVLDDLDRLVAGEAAAATAGVIYDATVLINRRLAMMTVPGEPFVDYQINWRDRCPVRDALFLGYANGYVGYFPTIRAAATGGYGAASSTTWVEVGAGERIVDNAVRRVYEMLGRLTEMPEDLKK